MKQLIIFDLDGTLAPSKSSIDSETVGLLGQLLEVIKVAVISGGGWPQLRRQLLSNLPDHDRLKNLCLLPTSGTSYYRYDNSWDRIYSEDFSAPEKETIVSALKAAVVESKLEFGQIWGDQIEDRGGQITFSGLGQLAPLSEKIKWDPDSAKRKQIKGILESTLPEFSTRLGGTTSIDVTMPGIDKAYGIRRMRSILGIALSDMVYVGDAVFPGGNDYPVKEAGVATIGVRDPEDTKRVIATLLACLEPMCAIPRPSVGML